MFRKKIVLTRIFLCT